MLVFLFDTQRSNVHVRLRYYYHLLETWHQYRPMLISLHFTGSSMTLDVTECVIMSMATARKKLMSTYSHNFSAYQ